MGERGIAAPLDPDLLRACLAPLLLRQPTGLLIAVSGGPDSICLMQSMARLARERTLPPLAVATVDHGLRPGSRADADFVLAEASAAGLPAHRLTWDGVKPTGALQEKARAARYGLLAACCRDLGADHLLTAHTLDDQAETVLFRLARGSGPRGLAGMRPISSLVPGLTQVRPLLGVAKARLVATCAARRWPTIHDPSNDDARFARTRLRRLLPALAAEGLDAAAFARIAARLDRAEAAIDHATDRVGRDAIRAAAPDLWRIAVGQLVALPPEFTTRLLGRALRACGGERPIRLDRLEQASDACRDAAARGAALRRTLHGCLLTLSEDGILSVSPERPRRRGGANARSRRAGATGAAPPVKRASSPSLGKGDSDPYIGA